MTRKVLAFLQKWHRCPATVMIGQIQHSHRAPTVAEYQMLVTNHDAVCEFYDV